MKQRNIFTLVAAFILVAAGCAADNAPAADWLAAQVDSISRKLYVYRDYSDSQNAFTQRGVMGAGYPDKPVVAEPVMNEAWPEAFSGVTSIKIEAAIAPGGWSGFYFGNGIQEAGSEPVFYWGDDDDLKAGVNLSGATKLVFHARAEQGETVRVQFLAGGVGEGKPNGDTGKRETAYLTLTDQWKRYEIPLQGADLSSISGGFGWVTNDSENAGKSSITFYVDEVYYLFPDLRSDPVFPASYEAVPLDNEGYFINSVAYSYDLAMTVIALAHADKTEQALKVADGLLFALQNDRSFAPSEHGLRNGYAAGNPSSFPGWKASSSKAPFARLYGFYDIESKEWWEDYYSDSHSTGNNAWALLAFLEAWRLSKHRPYLDAASTLASAIHSLKDPNGGFKAGWEGFDATQKKAGYISTEHCIDIYSAFTQLAAELDRSGYDKVAGLTPATLREDAAHARAFVLRMYDPVQGLFFTGTKTDGITVNRDVYPLDVNTWGLLAFHDDPDVDAERILATIKSRFAVPGGLYDFDDSKDGVWSEGSCQAIIVEKVLGNTTRYYDQLATITTMAEPDGSITAADRDGVTTGIWLEGVDENGNPIGNEWKYNHRVHTGATAWLALAQLGVNPLEPRRGDTGTARPSAPQAQVRVHEGRLHIEGLAPSTPVAVYTLAGREVVRLTSPSVGGGVLTSYPLPARGAYIVTAGTESWKIVW
jgi:hypothetical protein